MADLVIAPGLISIWMWNDARQREASVLPYLALTAIFGDAGPRLYPIARERQLNRAPVPAPGGAGRRRARLRLGGSTDDPGSPIIRFF